MGVVTFLLAQPNIDIDAEDDHGLTITALQHATELIQLEIMKILLKNGASAVMKES